MEAILALLTLTAMEIVLGIDNIVFIAILTGRLPAHQQPNARRLGLAFALVTRLLLLLTISWIMQLTSPIFHLSQLGFSGSWLGEEVDAISWKDLILFAGGLFLIWKSVREIHENIEGENPDNAHQTRQISFLGAILQIGLLDIIFSLDSVITAVGMAEDVRIMMAAVVVAVLAMLLFANSVSAFIERNPTLKMLALSFLILIGVMLVADAVGKHIEKGYIYFAMGFSLLVEVLNMRERRKSPPS